MNSFTEQDMARIGRALSREHGLEVRFCGNECYRKDNLIVLPMPPPEGITDEETLSLIRSFLDHEVGHVVGKSETAAMAAIDASRPKYGPGMLNTVEDLRVERLMQGIYEGCGINLTSGSKTICHRTEAKVRAGAQVHPWNAFGGAVYFYGKGLGMPEYIDAKTAEVVIRMNPKLQQALARSVRTSDLIPIAEEYIDEYKKLHAQEKPEEEQKPGEQQEGGQGKGKKKGKSKGKGQGRPEGSDGQGSAGDDDPDGQDGAGDSSSDEPGDGQEGDLDADQDDDEESASGPGEAEAEDGVSGGGGGDDREQGGSDSVSPAKDTDSETDGEGGKGAGGHGDPDQVKPECEPDGTNDFSAGQDMAQMVKEALDKAIGKMKQAEKIPWPPTANWHEVVPTPACDAHSAVTFGAAVRDASGPIQSQLRMLLQSEKKNGWLHSLRRGKPDPLRIAALAAKTSVNVLRKRYEVEAPDTAAILLIDGSGSMGGLSPLQDPRFKSGLVNSPLSVSACAAAAAFCRVMSLCGHASKVMFFGDAKGGKCDAASLEYNGVGMPGAYVGMYIRLWLAKDWGHNYTKALRGIAGGRVIHYGGTPMLPAMAQCVKELMSRREKRRLLMVFTDGVPNETPQAHQNLSMWAERRGIQVVYIGIMCDAVTHLHFRHAVVWDASKLAGAMMAELRKALHPSASEHYKQHEKAKVAQ